MEGDLGGQHLLDHVDPADQGALSTDPMAGYLSDRSQDGSVGLQGSCLGLCAKPDAQVGVAPLDKRVAVYPKGNTH